MCGWIYDVLGLLGCTTTTWQLYSIEKTQRHSAQPGAAAMTCSPFFFFFSFFPLQLLIACRLFLRGSGEESGEKKGQEVSSHQKGTATTTPNTHTTQGEGRRRIRRRCRFTTYQSRIYIYCSIGLCVYTAHSTFTCHLSL